MPTSDVNSSTRYPQGDAGFTFGEVRYISLAQHFYYPKALFVEDIRTAKKILNAKDPDRLKQLAACLADSPAEKAWGAICHRVLLQGLHTKFLQDPLLCDWLADQDDDAIRSLSSLWGISQTDVIWRGADNRAPHINWLGEALAEVKALLLVK